MPTLPSLTMYPHIHLRRAKDPLSLAASSPAFRSPVPSCHYYIDHVYRMIYIRTTKTGGTTVSQSLGMKEHPTICK
jgi:hypothetical protein